MYKASLIPVSEDLIKEANKLLYGFIWKGNDKIKRTALIIRDLKMPWTRPRTTATGSEFASS